MPWVWSFEKGMEWTHVSAGRNHMKNIYESNQVHVWFYFSYKMWFQFCLLLSWLKLKPDEICEIYKICYLFYLQ